jgi:hypothetical protein
MKLKSFWWSPILVLVGLVFGSRLGDGLVSDDWIFVAGAARAHSLADVLNFFRFGYLPGWFFRPLQWLLTWAIYRLAGTNAAAYHLVSMSFDLANAALFAALTYKLLTHSEGATPSALRTAVVASVFFLFNWRHHEAVFWYSSVSEILAAFFRLSALLLLVAAFDARDRRRRWVWYLAALAADVLGLLSKESAVVLPLEMLVIVVYLQVAGGKADEKRFMLRLAALLPFMLASACWAALYGSSVRAPASGAGGLVPVLYAGPFVLALRFVQYLNGHFMGNDNLALIRTTRQLIAETIVLGVVGVLAAVRRQYAWLCALFWTFVAVAPYAVVANADQISAGVPLLSAGIGGDRYLYYSAAPASLLLVLGGLWMAAEIRRSRGKKWAPAATRLIFIVMGVFLALNVGVLFWFGHEWSVAGSIADRTLQEVQARIPAPGPSTVLCLEDLPDTYHNKFVWRNGISDALRVSYGREDLAVWATVRPPSGTTAPPPLNESLCTDVLIYDEGSQSLVAKHN